MTRGAEHLAWLRTRRSVRAFTDEPVARDVLVRLLEAAITAPSSTNRQPWRFAVVRDTELRGRIRDAVRARTDDLTAAIRRGPHAEELGAYGDFFWEPLASAPVIVVPQVREHTDLLAHFLTSAGADPAAHALPGAMQPDRCAVAAAVMALLLQAHAEGLGACWMAGPMVAAPEIERACEIRPPWRMLGAVAVGHPAARTGDETAPPRKTLDAVARWLDGAHNDERQGDHDGS